MASSDKLYIYRLNREYIFDCYTSTCKKWNCGFFMLIQRICMYLLVNLFDCNIYIMSCREVVSMSGSEAIYCDSEVLRSYADLFMVRNETS